MAVDVYSENSVGITSPRISFSHDLEEQEGGDDDDDLPRKNNPMSCRLDHTLLDSSPFDFAFNVDTTTFLHSSTADELFSNGQILPTEVKKEEEEEEKTLKSPPKRNPEILIPCLDPRKKSLREFLEDSIDEEEEEKESPSTSGKSFWMFRRSNSLNLDKKRFSGSLKILSRSGSTGKFLEKIVEEENVAEKDVNPKPFWKFSRRRSSSVNSTNVNDNVKNQFIRRSSSLKCTISGANQGLNGSVKNLPRSKSTGSAPNQVGNPKNIDKSPSQKRQIKNMKIYGYYGNGNCNKNSVRVSPVMHIPSPYISRVSVDLLGFGSLFCNGSVKDRKKKC